MGKNTTTTNSPYRFKQRKESSALSQPSFSILPRLGIICFLLFSLLLSSCELMDKLTLKETTPDKEEVANYEDYGKNLALHLAQTFPDRGAYTQQEQAASLWIKDELEKLGYQVETQVFSNGDNTLSSQNLVARLPGEGMSFRNDQGELYEKHLEAVVGAHYDLPPQVGMEGDPLMTEDGNSFIYNGIQNNASGIGSLLTIAKELKEGKLAYDITLVAFGASSDNFAGARHFLSARNQTSLDIDVMYCIESIFAGDKLYAHSGLNSLVIDQKYQMRRKLYDAYTVTYNNAVKSSTGIDLLYNESSVLFDINGDGIEDVYREVSTYRSDHTPFDEAGIPIVFFESFDYNYRTVEEMKETKNVRIQNFKGAIRLTPNDASDLLVDLMGEMVLQKRINVCSYIIVEALKRGSSDAIDPTAQASPPPSDPSSLSSDTVILPEEIPSTTILTADGTT